MKNVDFWYGPRLVPIPARAADGLLIGKSTYHSFGILPGGIADRWRTLEVVKDVGSRRHVRA
jgi:hypothetical protein